MNSYTWSFADWAKKVEGSAQFLRPAGLLEPNKAEHQFIDLALTGPVHCSSRQYRQKLQENLQEQLNQRYIDDWRLRPKAQLVHHICREFHQDHLTQLPLLQARHAQLQAELPIYSAQLVPLGDHLHQLLNDLKQHMRHEEQVIFPALLEPVNADSFCAMALVHHNHDSHIKLALRIETLCQDLLEEGPATEILDFICALENQTMQLKVHIALEDKLLFVDDRAPHN